MKVNTVLLNSLMKSFQKEAYMPPAPAPQDPNAMAAGGAMPMDPNAMAGAMPMDPNAMAAAGGAMPMDPNAMAGGMPPMDPNTGLPVGMPTSPDGSMGPPPGMPAPGEEAAPEAAGQPITLTMEDLQAILQEAIEAGKGGGKASEEGARTSEDMEERISNIEQMLGAVVQSLGMIPPEGSGPGAVEELPQPSPEEAPMEEVPLAPSAQAVPPEAPEGLAAGMTPEALEAIGVPKTAEERIEWIKMKEAKRGEDILKKLKMFGITR